MSHIILIGFKNVGKSSVAKNLACALSLPFVDTDRVLEEKHTLDSGTSLSCREIMRTRGEEYFRALEHTVLKSVLASSKPTVIAVGGGAPLFATNEILFQNHKIIHVTAPKGMVYERIMINGWPAFFPRELDPYVSFQKIWADRMPKYERLAELSVENNRTLDEVVASVIQQL